MVNPINIFKNKPLNTGMYLLLIIIHHHASFVLPRHPHYVMYACILSIFDDAIKKMTINRILIFS